MPTAGFESGPLPSRLLSPDEARGLGAVARSVHTGAPRSSQIVPDTLAQFVRDVHARVETDGLSVIENLLAADDATALALMQLIGKPGADADEEDAGPLIMDLKPVPRDDAERVSSYYTWNEFDFHTDLAYVDIPPDYITVVCVQPDLEGQGLSLFSDIEACVKTMSASAVQTLQRPLFSIAAPPRCRTSQVNVPILRQRSNGRWRLRIRFDRTSTGDAEGQAALTELRDAFNRHKTAVLLPARSAYVCDNHRVVHGRTPFTFRNDGTDRHLKRIYGMRE